MVAPSRTAVVGGDGRRPEQWEGLGDVVIFRAPRDGGNGELRRLEAAIKSGSIGRVIILARFNGHSATRKIRRTCSVHGVPVVVVPGSGRTAADGYGGAPARAHGRGRA